MRIQGLDLSGLESSGLDLSGIEFSGHGFGGLEFRGLKFSGLDLGGLRFTGLEFSGLEFSGLDLKGLEFSGLEVSEFEVIGCEFRDSISTESSSANWISGSNFKSSKTEKYVFGSLGAPGGGLWGTEEPETLPSGPGRPNYANYARVSTNFETPSDLEKGPDADSMHRAEGSGVRPHAEVAKVLCIAPKLRTPEILRSRNPLSPYRVD